MTPVRALFASLFAAVLLGAGAFIAASFADSRPHELAPLLSPGRSPFSLWCFLAAWSAIVTGALGVIAAFLAFIAPEEDDHERFRRRGFPKSAPLVLIALSLAFLWFALRCAGTPATPPIAVPVEPASVSEPAESQLLGGEPNVEESAPAVAPVAEATSFSWRYMDPLLRGDSIVWGAGAHPFSDDLENQRLLCGKAWVAVTGSASEEGPPERNALRAERRAREAMARARAWLSQHDDCGATIVLGIDLGQHAPVAGGGDDGVSSAYQRQTLVVSRARRAIDERLTEAAAEAELSAFLADSAARAALLGPRIFPAEPQILTP